MIYQAYQAYADATDPMRVAARKMSPYLTSTWNGLRDDVLGRAMAVSHEAFVRTRLTSVRPPFGISSLKVGEGEIQIDEEVVHRTPFSSLVHFKKRAGAAQPRVLLIAPMAGHFATLLRGTARTLLKDHDVYITDWHNARDVPVLQGRFDLSDYIQHIIDFLSIIGPGTHIVAVCQPTVATLAAAAVMAEDGHPAQPASMTLMAGPIDTRVCPTAVNRLATSHPMEWFEQKLIGFVPLRYAGRMRRVYPGFMQITAFMSLNIDRHVNAFRDIVNHRMNGEEEKAKAIEDFYDEYFAMADLPAEFYLETIQHVFQEYSLPLGKLEFRGGRVNPKAIRRTALFTVEGEKDEICSVGQTLAAQDICSNVRPYMRRHLVQPGAGHYGVFNGRRWDNEIYPVLRNFIHEFE